MSDKRDVLQVLLAELAFLESGGYRNRPRYPWRPNFIFEDSPTCLDFHDPEHAKPCSECLLMQFVPQDRRAMRSPCRHIRLTKQGETVNSLYEWSTEKEMETALRGWLLQTISALEQEAQARAKSA